MSPFAELKRRHVVRVALAYLVFGWLVLQVADVVFPALGLPDWSITLVVVLLGIGFVAAVIVSWVYELTPEGIKRESEVDRSQSVTPQTGRRLELITIVMLVVAIGLLVADRFLFERTSLVLTPSDATRVSAETTPIIAVLPFKATGSDDGGFLATGLHDDLLTRLAKLDAYKVISRTSMMEYADTKNDRYLVSGFHFDFAIAFATAGLDDEAIAELRAMFEEPGGRSFRMVDAYPAFERLKGTPGYEALRAEFGEAR